MTTKTVTAGMVSKDFYSRLWAIWRTIKNNLASFSIKTIEFEILSMLSCFYQKLRALKLIGE